MREHLWITYDERALLGDEDDANVLVALGPPDVLTDEQAIKESIEMFGRQWFTIHRYDVRGKELFNGAEIYVHQPRPEPRHRHSPSCGHFPQSIDIEDL